ncbi:MAG: DUF4340 domain-containing protein, partial [Gammaproteobacteria bacterium]|nr:DUF4340 domain-containing protein [Gammaproteobacteria bacterium]
IALVALLAGLAAVAWLKPGQTDARLLQIDAEAVNHIVIERARKPVIRLEKRHRQWWVTSPIVVRANPARVASVLELTITTGDTRYPADSLELARFGLANPGVTVKLDGKTIAFGRINPVTQLRYVQTGHTVHLISDVLFNLESSGAAAYASIALLPAVANIEALRLPDIDIRRAKDGAWTASPAALAPRAIKNTLRAWREASAIRVGAYRKQPSGDRVTVALENGRAMYFEVVAREAELILARPGLRLQYHLPATSAASLLPVSADAEQP